MKNNRTYYYSIDGTVVADNTPDAHTRFMLYKDAQERADREQARTRREYQRKIVSQKQLGCAFIITGLVAVAMSIIIPECFMCALPCLFGGVYAATTTKIII